jgi:hypothetical protein
MGVWNALRVPLLQVFGFAGMQGRAAVLHALVNARESLFYNKVSGQEALKNPCRVSG